MFEVWTQEKISVIVIQIWFWFTFIIQRIWCADEKETKVTEINESNFYGLFIAEKQGTWDET